MLHMELITEMIVLPSGRIVDLSTDRSKHHALRQQGVTALVSPHSAHRKLYPLVDIIYRRPGEEGKAKRGWTEYDYEYSGYTLDTVRFASDWTEEDKTALCKWVQQDDQRRCIETARRRLVENQQQLSVKIYSSPQHLYSLLQHRLMTLPLKHATAKHWIATINKHIQSGVREEEIQWSGLPQYLLQQPADKLISKTQLLENWNDKNLRLELSTINIGRPQFKNA